MKLKIDANGNVVVSDGKPVYISEDGKEIAFDAPGTVATISRLNGEAKGHRERAEAAEARLKTFGDLDPDKARKAIEDVSKIDAKKLIDAGEVDRLRAEITSAFQKQLDEEKALRANAEKALDNEIIGGSFSRSKYISENLVIPADVVQSHFGKHFSVKDGKVLAKDASGNPIYDPATPGEYAGFDKAMETIVGQYAGKDSILKGNNKGGSNTQFNHANRGGSSISRQAFEALSPEARAKAITVDKLTVVD